MRKKKNISALQEKEGVNENSHLNKKFIFKKNKDFSTDQFVKEILKGNTVFLSKAITFIESNNKIFFEKGQQILQKLLPHTGKSIRIGVTGVPGVGKSTFIESLGQYYTSFGHKVAVLAIDPSSSISKGSILGDKTRMEKLSKNPLAYIRPTASGNALGGVARKTRESVLLCEAAGFNKIIIETVGVGQSETLVHSMTDFFLLLKLAGAGDELQGIKRGIMEMADLIVINKAEADNIHAAKLAQKAFQTALHYFPPKESGWTPKVLLASALNNIGIDKISSAIDEYTALTKKNNFFDKKRKKQEEYWFYETIENELKKRFYQNPEIKKQTQKLLEEIFSNRISAFEAADILLQKAFSNEK